MDWGYTEWNGPDTWKAHYPVAAGNRQSPIDIKTNNVDCDLSLGEMNIHYAPQNCLYIENTGRGAQVSVDGEGSCLVGGGLKPYGKFQLAQFHFHWGQNNGEGSEHTLDGKRFAAELHLVHWNTTQYRTVEEAMHSPNGLAVLGVFIKVGKENPAFTELEKYIQQVTFSGQKMEMDSFDPKLLLPEKLNHYYFYHGSLTTPPCYESVLWTVFQKPIQLSEEQLELFRSLSSCEPGTGHTCITHNYRPPCPIGDRRVRASFIG
ncbi:carbonic anhydrase 2-like isoform X2 [Tubulanus polymorphus]